MTREEAKRLLEIEKECMNCDPDRLCYNSYLMPVCENYPFKESHSWEEAVDVAIKALSAEPCEDAISRAWLKEAIHNFYYGLKHTPTEEDIQAYIDAAPSVTPKQNDVLDKIRAEIEQAYCKVSNDYDKGRNYGLYMAAQIIDKYKGEMKE